MKAFIPAAGLGTRLKPWTLSHPKALFPVDGVPMLQRVVERLHSFGIFDITVNCHHFASQIKDFVAEKGWDIKISDESDSLLETGGGLLKAASLLEGDEPILVHNVDILSNADLKALGEAHVSADALSTLLVSPRDSSRKLLFDEGLTLKGWHSLKTGEYKPACFKPSPRYQELAFSGIYVVSPEIFSFMHKKGWKGKFSIMDFFLSTLDEVIYKGFNDVSLKLKDIGKSSDAGFTDCAR